jgi:hypothetical protein
MPDRLAQSLRDEAEVLAGEMLRRLELAAARDDKATCDVLVRSLDRLLDALKENDGVH